MGVVMKVKRRQQAPIAKPKLFAKSGRGIREDSYTQRIAPVTKSWINVPLISDAMTRQYGPHHFAREISFTTTSPAPTNSRSPIQFFPFMVCPRLRTCFGHYTSTIKTFRQARLILRKASLRAPKFDSAFGGVFVLKASKACFASPSSRPSPDQPRAAAPSPVAHHRQSHPRTKPSARRYTHAPRPRRDRKSPRRHRPGREPAISSRQS
jgi:hypothetical protein